MWFIGMIVGAIGGAMIGSVGNFDGAMLGLVVGAVAGAVLLNKFNSPARSRLETLEDAVRQLNARVKALETGARVPVTEARDVTPTEQSEREAAAPAPAVAMPEAPQPTGPWPAPVAAHTSSDEVPPVVPAAPREPSALWRFLFGGNTLVRVGILVLFFGVAFLLKYAADQGLVPIELRLTGVALGGIVLLVLGWRLRHKRAGYALMLQGGGIGIFYLTVFAALRLYSLVPPGLAFALLAGMAFSSALLAIVQDSKALAITGAAGGFLAPILASTGGGSHVALFSFYAILNAGILFIAWHKAWRELNVVGFAFTALIGLAWGADRYRPEHFATTEPFLILFFLMYVAIAVLFALRQAPKLTHYVDGTIVFGVPLVAFGMQAAMLKDTEFGNAFSALALAAFYLMLAYGLFAKKRESLRLLVESFLALGIGFATLAVPLALDVRWTSAVWAIEGAAIVWIGVRQNRWLARAFGMLLQPAAGLAMGMDLEQAQGTRNLTPVFNSLYLGCVMVSVAALFINAYIERHREQVRSWEVPVSRALFVWGVLWWFGGGMMEIDRHVTNSREWMAVLLFFAVSCAGFAVLWRRLDWRSARYTALLMPMLMTAVLVAMVFLSLFSRTRHPFEGFGWLAWIAAFAVHLWVLHGHRGEAFKTSAWLDWWHAAGFWLLAIVASWEVGWQIYHAVGGGRVWSLIAWALVPGVLIALFAARGGRLGWPVSAQPRGYLYLGALPVAVYLLCWIVLVNFKSDGNPDPLPYVPLINPLDIAQSGALLALAIWYVRTKALDVAGVRLPATRIALMLLGMVLFIALNGVLLRTLHHYADVPLRFNAMMASTIVQASLSLFWSLLALAAMFFANKRAMAASRALWFVGAALLAVVIAKLALIDLSNTGTVARIVSFIGVGLFCVVIGYFAPVPPKGKTGATTAPAGAIKSVETS